VRIRTISDRVHHTAWSIVTQLTLFPKRFVAKTNLASDVQQPLATKFNDPSELRVMPVNQRMVSYRRRGRLITACIVSMAIAGCSRQTSPTFVSSDAVGKLPEIHQQQISESLARMFGSPSNPRIVTPIEKQSDGEVAIEWTETSDRSQLQHLKHGSEVYEVRCAGCHGVTGDGKGEAAPYLHPKPRDYRLGVFKFTSTPFGLKPTRADLVRTIRRGAKGTSMPAFPWMSNEDLQAVIDYVILLSQRGEIEHIMAQTAGDYGEDEKMDAAAIVEAVELVRGRWRDAETLAVQPVTAEPTMNDESIRKGRELFVNENCWKCHGKDAKGQTEWLSHEFIAEQQSLPEDKRIQINRDAWGDVAPAADITARMLHGGRRPIDIYRRIHTGINGTPMPAFDQAFSNDPNKTWHLVHYIMNIVNGGPVE
jgi:mono/diheme cytochrome c family protein